jgi:23S rRNA pseudouridine2605 synthase
MERRKTLSSVPYSDEKPLDGDDPKPRERKSAADRPATRQSFFKNRTPQSESYGEAEYVDKPRRASRTAHDDGDRPRRATGYKSDGDRPRRATGYKSGDDRPRRATGYKSGDDRPHRATGYKNDGDRRQKPSAFDKFHKEKPRSERRDYSRDRSGDRDRPYVRKPYRDEDTRSRRPTRDYGGWEDATRREKPLGGYHSRSRAQPQDEKPYARKPYGAREDYAPQGGNPRAGKKPPVKIQVKEPNMPVRLNKFIANSGVCSRREADEYIQSGEVTVNGVVVTTLGTKVLPTDEIRWNGDKLSGEKKVYIVLNKPKGYVTTVEDPHADKTVMELIAGACSERVYPVGRLDKNTTGVLLFTNDGELTKTLTHPSYSKRKVYQVTLDKTLKKPDMEQLVAGVELEDGLAVADEVGYTNMEDKAEVGLEIHSGRNRVVRRMFETLGYEVKKLDRVYFAGLTKKSLERGKWRFLSPREVSTLKMGAYE